MPLHKVISKALQSYTADTATAWSASQAAAAVAQAREEAEAKKKTQTVQWSPVRPVFHQLPVTSLATPIAPPEPEPNPLPRVTQLEALHGWRMAYLCPSQDNKWVELRSISRTYTLSPDEEAKCLASHHSGELPSLSCTCGFYALKSPSEIQIGVGGKDGPLPVLLQVDLTGRIIEGENGFRASHQSILGCWVPSRCHAFMCSETAAVVEFSLGYDPARDKTDHLGWSIGPSNVHPAWPSCREHVVSTRTATLAQISNRIGIEVRWYDDAEVERIAATFSQPETPGGPPQPDS